MLKPLRQLLPKSIRSVGVAQQIKASLICEELQKLIEQRCGETLAQQAKAVAIKQGQVVIECANSAVLQEIRFQQAKLLQELQQKFPDEKLQRIYLRLTQLISDD